MVFGRPLTFQRRRHSGNLKVLVTDGSTTGLTLVCARDA